MCLGESPCPVVRECNLGSENVVSWMLGFVRLEFFGYFFFQSNCVHLNFENIFVLWLVTETSFCPLSKERSFLHLKIRCLQRKRSRGIVMLVVLA